MLSASGRTLGGAGGVKVPATPARGIPASCGFVSSQRGCWALSFLPCFLLLARPLAGRSDGHRVPSEPRVRPVSCPTPRPSRPRPALPPRVPACLSPCSADPARRSDPVQGPAAPAGSALTACPAAELCPDTPGHARTQPDTCGQPRAHAAPWSSTAAPALPLGPPALSLCPSFSFCLSALFRSPASFSVFSTRP